MNREPIRAGYTILVGVAMLGLWGMFYATGQIPELTTAPYEIGYHLAAETLTALALVTAGVGLFRRHAWAWRLYPVALGMLLYTVINSAGYYAQLREIAMVGMFTVFTATTLLLIIDYLTGRTRMSSQKSTQRGDLDA
jgi:hypothetical protein